MSETESNPTVPESEASETAPAEANAAEAALAAATNERDRAKEQLLRTLADFDNYRKRTTREKQDEYRRGKEDVLKELLPVFDNLERAAVSARPDADVGAIVTGLKMVLKLFEDTLVRVGGKRVASVGAAFDPNVHEAIAQVESHEHPAGTIAQELVAGYSFGDRLLRAAMVAVSKGPPSAEVNEATEAEHTPDAETAN
jgi:molecular chaperone GrpE